MKIIHLWLLISSLTVSLVAKEKGDWALNCSMKIHYNETPESVGHWRDWIEEGHLYARLRSHFFAYLWGDELKKNGDYTSRKSHYQLGLGANLIYRSAYLHGFGFELGFFGTYGVGTLTRDTIRFEKSGKDTLSRYDLLTKGKRGFVVPALASLRYRYARGEIVFGRQAVNTVLLKANDSKMVPNTFEGVTLQDHSLPSTLLKVGYLYKQKLRDHSRFHHLLAFGDDPSDPYSAYSQNDDAAMHRGLGLSILRARGIDDRLYFLSLKNHSLPDTVIKAEWYYLPRLLSTFVVEGSAHYALGEWRLLPAFRLLYQFDKGAGAIGGANLKKDVRGYSDPKRIDASMAALRLDLVHGDWKFRLAYSAVADKGDIVAPWRGFPTGGYTRVMGQYNWYAATKTWAAQAEYALGSLGIFDRSKCIVRYGIQNYDDTKPGVPVDSDILNIDLFAKRGDFYTRLRWGRLFGTKHTTPYGTTKADPRYNEIRWEFDYLF